MCVTTITAAIGRENLYDSATPRYIQNALMVVIYELL